MKTIRQEITEAFGAIRASLLSGVNMTLLDTEPVRGIDVDAVLWTDSCPRDGRRSDRRLHPRSERPEDRHRPPPDRQLAARAGPRGIRQAMQRRAARDRLNPSRHHARGRRERPLAVTRRKRGNAFNPAFNNWFAGNTR